MWVSTCYVPLKRCPCVYYECCVRGVPPLLLYAHRAHVWVLNEIPDTAAILTYGICGACVYVAHAMYVCRFTRVLITTHSLIDCRLCLSVKKKKTSPVSKRTTPLLPKNILYYTHKHIKPSSSTLLNLKIATVWSINFNQDESLYHLTENQIYD